MGTQCAKAAGVDIEVIGMGMTYPGLGLKIMAMIEWLPAVPDEDYILLLDAYDVLSLAPLNKDALLARFHSFCAPIVFSAETRCHPDTSLELLTPKHEGVFHYLNSGSYMGRADDIKKMFTQVLKDLSHHYNWAGADYRQVNDQRWFTRHWMLHSDEVVLDINGEMFHTLHQVDPKVFTFVDGQKGVLFSSMTNTTPAILHGNGKDGKDIIKLMTSKLRNHGWLAKGQAVAANGPEAASTSAGALPSS